MAAPEIIEQAILTKLHTAVAVTAVASPVVSVQAVLTKLHTAAAATAVPHIRPSPQTVEKIADISKCFEKNKETMTAAERAMVGQALALTKWATEQDNWALEFDVLLACEQAGVASTIEQEVQDKATKRKAKRRFAKHWARPSSR